MLTTEILLTIAVSLVIGAGIGIFLGRYVLNSKKQKGLAQQLQDAQNQLGDYQASVAQHFADTSQRVGEFTQSYLNLHEQLSKDAMKLANPDISARMLAAKDKYLLPGVDITDESSDRETSQSSVATDADQNSSDSNTSEQNEDYAAPPCEPEPTTNSHDNYEDVKAGNALSDEELKPEKAF